MSDGAAPAGSGSLVAARQRHGTALATASASSPLRFLFPRDDAKAPNAPAWVCMTTLGGGLVSGDAIDLRVEARHDAALLMTTQASTKIYRGRSEVCVRARVDGTLVALMDPTSCFANASYAQNVEIELGEKGSLVWLESVTSGRPAFETAFSFSSYASRIRVRRGERAILSDAVLLDKKQGFIASRFARKAGAPFDTLATLVALGEFARPLFSAMLAESPPAADSDLLVSATRFDRAGVSGVVVRIAATSAEAASREARRRLSDLGTILTVDPFTSRW